MGGAIQGFLIFFSVTGGTSALVFILLWFFRRSPKKIQANCVSYDVMERSSKRIALRNPSPFCWLMALTYVGLFYLSLPVLIWRYGIYRALGLIIIPIGISFGISQFLAITFGLDAMVIGFFMIIIIRAIGGLYVVANDLKCRENALVFRGWSHLGSCQATSRKHAKNYFQDALKISDTGEKKCRSGWTSVLTGLIARLPYRN